MKMEWIEPMKPILSNKIIEGDEWSHEIKWDGIRGLVYLDRGHDEFAIKTLKGKDRTAFYPELNCLNELVNYESVILDGEIVVLDENLRPTFSRSLIRENVSSQSKINYYKTMYPVNYIIFDILYADGKKLTNLPLYKRREYLNGIKRNNTVAINNIYEDGHWLFELMQQKAWEGIVTKDINSEYYPDKKHSSWYKTKLTRIMQVVVGGLQMKGDKPNSILVGIYINRTTLSYVGKVSLGLTSTDIELLASNVAFLQQDKCPFSEMPKKSEDVYVWIKPTLTCKVSFLEYTEQGNMRHPKIIGFTNINPLEATGIEEVTMNEYN